VKKAPPRGLPDGDNGYFEILTKAVFQAGFSWDVIAMKWPAFMEAFEGFDVDRVAAFTDSDVERLVGNAEIVRNRRKIQGTIENARTIQALAGEHGSVRAWLQTSADLPWPKRKKAVSAPFKFFGPSGAYFFLWSVAEAVPPHHQESTWTDPVPPGSPESLPG
jgi:DNA-3-methyladenine glycosylase I